MRQISLTDYFCKGLSIKIVCVFSNHHKKQPAFRFLKVQAAFDRKVVWKLFFRRLWYYGRYEDFVGLWIKLRCCRLNYGMVWNHSVATKTTCVRTAHTLHLNLKVCVARR